jgi:signal transduction histidine kinase
LCCTLFWVDALGITTKLARPALYCLLPLQCLLLSGLFLNIHLAPLFERLSAGLNVLVALGFAGFVGYSAFSKPTVSRALLFVALCGLFLALVFGITKHGLGGMRAYLFPWLAYAMLLFCILQTWELLEGYNRALRSTRVNARYFETQLEAKRAELDASFGALRDAASSEAVEQERRRIMREIHDGIGSSLVNAMSLVRRDDPEQESIGLALQDSMNELRMAIDALQPHEADLLTALGTLRTRVQPALKAAGIELKWEVQPVPEISRLTPENTLHLYRFVQEAFANVIKHAQATRVTVITDFDERRDMVSVMIDDNGKGWRPHRAGERRGGGSETLRLRAQKLGGLARIMPLAPGTRVMLSFPRSASAAAASIAHADFSPSVPGFVPSRPS